jgi:hypothetical protein
MSAGKVIGGVATAVFATVTGVLAWKTKQASVDKKSKKYKGYLAGTIISSILLLVSLIYFVYVMMSGGSEAPVELTMAQQQLDGATKAAAESNKFAAEAKIKALNGNVKGAAQLMEQAGALRTTAVASAEAAELAGAQEVAAKRTAAANQGQRAAELQVKAKADMAEAVGSAAAAEEATVAAAQLATVANASNKSAVAAKVLVSKLESNAAVANKRGEKIGRVAAAVAAA